MLALGWHQLTWRFMFTTIVPSLIKLNACFVSAAKPSLSTVINLCPQNVAWVILFFFYSVDRFVLCLSSSWQFHNVHKWTFRWLRKNRQPLWIGDQVVRRRIKLSYVLSLSALINRVWSPWLWDKPTDRQTDRQRQTHTNLRHSLKHRQRHGYLMYNIHAASVYSWQHAAAEHVCHL